MTDRITLLKKVAFLAKQTGKDVDDLTVAIEKLVIHLLSEEVIVSSRRRLE